MREPIKNSTINKGRQLFCKLIKSVTRSYREASDSALVIVERTNVLSFRLLIANPSKWDQTLAVSL